MSCDVVRRVGEPAMVIVGGVSSDGDWVGPPPSSPEKQRLGQEGGDAGGDDVDRDTGDDVVDAEDHGGDRVQDAAEAPKTMAPSDAGDDAVVVGEVAGTERAEDHHALEADVDHAGALGPQAAETGQRDGDRRRSGRAAACPTR